MPIMTIKQFKAFDATRCYAQIWYGNPNAYNMELRFEQIINDEDSAYVNLPIGKIPIAF